MMIYEFGILKTQVIGIMGLTYAPYSSRVRRWARMEKIKAVTVLEAFVLSFCVSTSILNSAPAAAEQANVGPCAGSPGLWVFGSGLQPG